MDVSRSAYFEVVDGENRVVEMTYDLEVALRALPVGGEIYEVVKVVWSTPRQITTTIVKEVLELS
ncbi:MAG: hypothetical protein IJO06_08350 [Thermoguttaceae bacterium]|nr:hypothetical protein [Thermoguttaceae bacterium]